MTFDSHDGKLYVIQSDNDGSLLERGDAIVVIDIENKDKSLFYNSGRNSGIHFSDIIYDHINYKLFLSGAFRKKTDNENIIEEDSLYIIDVLTRQLSRISLYSDIEEGKEGDVGEVSILPKTNKIYVNSVYAQGGKKVLYIVEYQDESQVKVNEVAIPGSPRALETDIEKNTLYVLGHTKLKDELNSCIYVIDGATNSVQRIILIGEELQGLSPAEKNLISLDSKKGILYAIINHKLYSVDLNNDSVKCLLEESDYYKVIVDSLTGLIYVATLVQTDSENPYQFCISVVYDEKIQQKLSVPQFATSINMMTLEPKRKILCIFTSDYSGRGVREDIIFYSIDKLDEYKNSQ